MKSLKESLKNNLNQYQMPDIGWDFDNWLDINQITNVTEEVIDIYMDMTWNDHSSRHSNNRATPDQILEFLESTQIDFLLRQIKNEFGDAYNSGFEVDSIRQISDRPGTYLSIPKDLYTDKTEFNKFCKFLRKFQWHFSNWEENIGNKSIIYVEPKYSENVTEYVKDNADGIIYHLCRKSLTNMILQSGLRTKGEDTKLNTLLWNNPIYRKFPNRVFFFYCLKTEEFEPILLNTARMFNKNMTYKKLKSEYDLLKIDLKQAKHLQLYKDPAGTDNSVYTYSYVPPKFINKVEF